jgi:hypothetical protein
MAVVTEIVVCVPAAWFWLRSSDRLRPSKQNEEKKTRAKNPAQDTQEAKESNEGDDVVKSSFLHSAGQKIRLKMLKRRKNPKNGTV